jgi:hypothetical protein
VEAGEGEQQELRRRGKMRRTLRSQQGSMFKMRRRYA